MAYLRLVSALSALLTLTTATPVAAQTTNVSRHHHVLVATRGATSNVGTVVVHLDEDRPRVRLGITGHGGALVNEPAIGLGGLSLRAGVQVSDAFAFFYQPTGLAGMIVDRPGGDAAAGLMFNSLIAEFTFADLVSIGAGPAVDLVWGCARTVQREIACADRGPFFGIHGALAVRLASRREGTRRGIALSADVHTTLFDDDHIGVTLLAGVGLDTF